MNEAAETASDFNMSASSEKVEQLQTVEQSQLQSQNNPLYEQNENETTSLLENEQDNLQGGRKRNTKKNKLGGRNKIEYNIQDDALMNDLMLIYKKKILK